MLSLGTLEATLEEIKSFLVFIEKNTACITIKHDGVDCSFRVPYNGDGCIHCMAKEALKGDESDHLSFTTKILKRIRMGDECLYVEKEYL